MTALGAFFAILALDEAGRASRPTHPRREAAAEDGLDPRRGEARASAWRRWVARGREADAAGPRSLPASPGRRAAHV
jgi:hypothetical protein